MYYRTTTTPCVVSVPHPWFHHCPCVQYFAATTSPSLVPPLPLCCTTSRPHPWAHPATRHPTQDPPLPICGTLSVCCTRICVCHYPYVVLIVAHRTSHPWVNHCPCAVPPPSVCYTVPIFGPGFATTTCVVAVPHPWACHCSCFAVNWKRFLPGFVNYMYSQDFDIFNESFLSTLHTQISLIGREYAAWPRLPPNTVVEPPPSPPPWFPPLPVCTTTSPPSWARHCPCVVLPHVPFPSLVPSLPVCCTSARHCNFLYHDVPLYGPECGLFTSYLLLMDPLVYSMHRYDLFHVINWKGCTLGLLLISNENAIMGCLYH